MGTNFIQTADSLGMSLGFETMDRTEIEHHLSRAIEKNELSVAYHPIIETYGRRTVGVEALLRWECEALGFIEPNRFIPVAEECGLIGSIGIWVMETACRQVAEWNKTLVRPLRLAVNVSPHQLTDGSVFVGLERVVFEGFDPTLLEFEVTEGVELQDHPETIETLNRLKDLGVGLSIDDFGTGYSSLSYLKNLPFDNLKVDRAFIDHIVFNPNDLAIVSAMINMAKILGLKVICEGVTSEEQMGILAAYGSDFVQGFLFGEPVPSSQFEKKLAV